MLYLRFELSCVLLAQLALALQSTQNNFIDALVQRRSGGRRLETANGQLAREHLVKHDAEGINVSAMIDVAGFLQLLWRHVMRRAERSASPGECHRGLV